MGVWERAYSYVCVRMTYEAGDAAEDAGDAGQEGEGHGVAEVHVAG